MTAKIVKIYISVIITIFAMGVFFPSLTALANTTTSPTKVRPATVTLTGTIHKLAVEGTCYQLAADNGKKYELMGKFPKIDGTRVRVSGSICTDLITICQVGQPLKIKAIKVIK
jgi:hypothetical protein